VIKDLYRKLYSKYVLLFGILLALPLLTHGWLEGYPNQPRYDDHRFWRDKGGSIAVVALTSDAMVKEVRSRVGPKVNRAYMWNLGYVSMGELARRLNLDLDVDTLWRLAGGNPRALVRIKVDELKKWVEKEVLAVIQGLLDEARRSSRKGCGMS
jgi:hypothetical protein